ncbi:Conserved protein {ECO:0000313/EMBL:AAB85567,1} [Methanothermobacter wolfeii]|uniref:CRISPR system Cms protein Csm5 n=1 Tax=Methanothermobacter wolfeii TaxID=145261 RepID=A0A9E7RS37_METWO|nr:type III-A CRISPR-associated RAMP protein Csm5 [Methanothermobacter wolfeii]UXH31360.1 type III-A CRISPR-associated RAMP protein Csm5 [Methanothermobacter wolfeii]SCM58152.1 Conserved protein {ECO:0000313/EMBL:AAB85567,1} [Methanothermobacter wolfeii]
MKCTLQVITPVHVGNGLKYGPQEFYTGRTKDGKKIFGRVDVSRFYSNLDDDLRDKFIHNLSTPDFRLDSIKEFKRTARKSVRYRGLLKTDASEVKEVSEHIKTLDELYIPGSSIKGSIRTALLYEHLSGDELKGISEAVSQALESKRKRNWKTLRKKQEEIKDIIDSFFASDRRETAKKDGRETAKKDGRETAKKSIMRFLEVTDTTTFKSPAIYPVKVLKVSDNSYKRFRYENFLIYMEFLPKTKRKLEFEMNFTYNGRYDRIGLGNKRRLVTPETIKESLYTFSRDYIEHERKFASRYGVDFLEKIYRKLGKQNSPDAPLMRIGHGSGFLATTIGLRFKEDDPMTYESIRKFKRGRSYQDEFPKTRKLIDGEIPPGWVKVIFNEE